MRPAPATPLVIYGWTVFAHPLFLDQIEALIQQVDALRSKDPDGYRKKNATKRLAAISRLAFEVIPQDPTRAEYRLGNTLGDEHKHWFRARFFQQYRLFFRFHAASKIIVLASGHPPDDWAQLLAQANDQRARLDGIAGVLDSGNL